ncbi:ATP-binding cassette domain-containing protein [Streptomyces sp. NPDC002577]
MTTNRTEFAIAADDLVKTYPGGVQALDGLSLAVQPGEIFGLLGPNGAGKSTTMKILTTLARPDSGAAHVAGHDVLLHPERVRRAIGVVAQRSGADPVATGRDNLVLQARLYGLRGSALRRRVDTLLERFGLTGAAGRPVRTYSGGMQRRLDIALSLVHTPDVLFLDEPTTGLDPQARTAMWVAIEQLAAEEGMAVLLTTHHLEEADRLTARLAIVDRGRIVVSGDADELKGALRGDTVYIGLDGGPGLPDADLVCKVLGTVPGLREISVSGNQVGARADDGAATLPRALTALDRIGLRAATVAVSRPSLDDVYLHHTGHRLPLSGSLSGGEQE